MNEKEYDWCTDFWSPGDLEEKYSEKFREVPRYILPNGGKVPYFQEKDENDWEHIVGCVCLANHLAKRFPELREVFDFKIVVGLLWIHEVDELFRPDVALCLSGDELRDQALGNDAEFNEEEIILLEDFLIDIGFQEQEVPEWLGYLKESEQPQVCEDPNLLFVKLIDKHQANLLVANFGNFETPKQKKLAKKSFKMVAGPLFKKLMGIVYLESAEAAEIIRVNMLYKLNEILIGKGVDLEVENYVPDSMKSKTTEL